MLEKLLKEIKNNPVIYFLLGLILSLGLFLRVYNIDNVLGFYYDQGRDALTIWEMWHSGNIPFIGPTTGIAGIFRGPFYYYLIAPFYLLGGGNPVFPSVFLSFLTVLSSLMMYILGLKIQDRVTGLFAAGISAFSFNIVMASRWLSNPTPMLLLSLILVWAMLKKNWPAISFVFGLSLFHFGSSGEAFYGLAILVYALWNGFPRRKEFWLSVVLFLLTALPLIAFDIKNDGLIVGNIKKFLITDQSFALPTPVFIEDKFLFYYDVFTNKIFNARYHLEKLVLSGILLFFVYNLHALVKNKGVKILLILLISTMIGLIFFQGNFGNIYDYYLTGYYLLFLLLFSITLGHAWKYKFGKLLVLYFVYLFLTNNANVLKFKLTDGGLGPNSISFIAQKKAVDWIRQDAGEERFNVDVYVPPVIPYAYDYLMKWRGITPSSDRTPLLYLLYEQDNPNPDRLEAWLARQKGIGKVVETQKFGAITVERRLRIQ